jgi:hypothetical protein
VSSFSITAAACKPTSPLPTVEPGGALLASKAAPLTCTAVADTEIRSSVASNMKALKGSWTAVVGAAVVLWPNQECCLQQVCAAMNALAVVH